MTKGILLPISRLFILLMLLNDLELQSLALDSGQGDTIYKISEEPVTLKIFRKIIKQMATGEFQLYCLPPKGLNGLAKYSMLMVVRFT